MWLTNLNQAVCREDYEENLEFYAEEIEEVEAELTRMRPELIARWRKRIKIPSKASNPIAVDSSTVPTNADEVVIEDAEQDEVSSEPT